jgi:hypothetical protein
MPTIKLTTEQMRAGYARRAHAAAFGPLSPPKWSKSTRRPQATVPRPAADLPKAFDYLKNFKPVPAWLQAERRAAVPTATPVPTVVPTVIEEPLARPPRTTLLTE